MPRSHPPLALAVLIVTGIISSSVAFAAEEIPRPEHPTPQAVRPQWASLNGTWEFRFDPDDQGQNAKWFDTGAQGFDRTIVVPFPWESALSGIHELDGPKVGWYRRTFRVPDDFPAEQHVWLHFGAVDWQADVWVNGQHVAAHEGGYTPFSADITEAVERDGDNTLVVRAFDPTDPSLPTGKQVGWYTRTSGIWQTVWLEARPEAFIQSFRVVTQIDPARASFQLDLGGLKPDKTYTVSVEADDPSVQVPSTEGFQAKDAASAQSTVKLAIDAPKLWSPDSPYLYDVTLQLKGEDGQVLDSVKTYFGLRTIARGKFGDEPFERVLLNGKPIYLRGALDQSFNPEGIYTAPSDEFLKKDIELAKSMGTNFLRIHIKPDEPRRLHWADRLGMLIMEDMPNTWRQNEKARKAWESTMRETLARDANHPAIFSWVMFNETWGLGSPDDYKASTDTQQWVKSMVAAAREIDPTRLVEDNSPCNYDHVAATDLNSWHFYIDNPAQAARHIAEVVEQSHEGSGFNYCPGEKMNTAPLINSEYGAVSAGGGDRDISWGFRDLTTQLRKYPKIQGYIYTELTDIEWEHNGFANYDRSPKVFGYDAFVPGMTVADLQGADFIGYDGPPAIEVAPGDLIEVRMFVSHYSDRTDPPVLKWWIAGADDSGQGDKISPREREVTWKPYDVTPQKPLKFRIHGPFVGALGMVLEDKQGQRLAANFVNIVVRPESPQPRIERLGDHAVAIRFRPEDYSTADFSGPHDEVRSKVHGEGIGAFTYKLKLPKSIQNAKPRGLEVFVEASAKAGREKVDWASRRNPQDYPQTEASRAWPSTLQVEVNGQPFARTELPDDPADARGVLSHLAGVEHGSHGTFIHFDAELPAQAQADVAAGKTLDLSFTVPDDAPAGQDGGLAIFGDAMGRYPTDPTIVLHTEEILPEDLGAAEDAPLVVDTAISRRVELLAAGDTRQSEPSEWLFTTERPGEGWNQENFDATSWSKGRAGFGTAGTPGIAVHTRWDTPAIWLRASVELPPIDLSDRLSLRLFHDEDVEIFVNGKPLLRRRGYVTSYVDERLNSNQSGLFRPGRNTIAVSCRQSGGGQGIDMGLTLFRD